MGRKNEKQPGIRSASGQALIRGFWQDGNPESGGWGTTDGLVNGQVVVLAEGSDVVGFIPDGEANRMYILGRDGQTILGVFDPYSGVAAFGETTYKLADIVLDPSDPKAALVANRFEPKK